MLDDFTGTDKAWFTVTNGGHTELARSRDPRPVDRVPADLRRAGGAEAAAARRTWSRRSIGQEVWESPVTLPPDRFAERDVARGSARDLRGRPAAARPVRERRGRRTRPPVRALRERLRALAGPGHPGTRRGTSTRAARSSTGRPAPTAPTRTPTTRRARSRRRCPGTDTDSTWLPLPAWNWTSPPAASAGRVRDRAAHVRHGDGRNRQRRPLDQGRRLPTSTCR